MVQTQIYLTEVEQEALRSLAQTTGRSQSELIREAIDAMLERQKPMDRRAAMRRARGLWSDRTDLPNFRELREELGETLDAKK